MGKKVMSLLQNENGVMIRCSDNSTYHGDILVGADGAYSAVRQHLFSDLKKKRSLPSSDDAPLPYSFVCLVGQTHSLDPEEFPDLKLERSQFITVSSKETPYFVRVLLDLYFKLMQAYDQMKKCLALTVHPWCTVGHIYNQEKHLVLDGDPILGFWNS